MAQRAVPAAELTRTTVNLARAITVGLRSWGFYPPEHPAIALAVDRLIKSATEAAAGGLLQLSVTPHALMIDGLPLESADRSVSECAALLHDRDILQLTLVSAPGESSIRSLLTVLSLDRQTRRAQGGPATIWAAQADVAILIEQIDYQEILEREGDAGASRRDATWKAIVRSIIMGRKTFSSDDQRRLLEISADVSAIGELTRDCTEPYYTPDGAPMLTTQATAILGVYRHLARTVTTLEPERAKDVMQSLTLATAALDPATAVELLRQEDAPDDSLQLIDVLKHTFDDQQIALLLARALATPGHPVERLVQILDTLVSDESRQYRVLKLAERLINERDFGSRRPIEEMRRVLDELLLKYHEKEIVSADYRASMDKVGGRAAELAALGLPPEMDEWLATVGHENVRRLSGQLLIDLLRNESDPQRVGETARDIAALVEDVILAGAFGEGVPLVEALGDAVARTLSPVACKSAIESIGASAAFGEAVAALGDLSSEELGEFEKLARAVGPAAVDRLLGAFERESGVAVSDRASAIIVRVGVAAIPRLVAGLDDQGPLVQCAIAHLLGRIGSPAAVPPLQTLLRRTDLSVMQTAVASLAQIDDPAAARALHTVLRAATGPARAAVIAALLGLKDARVVPMLTRILQESDPFGDDHPLVLDALAALAAIRDDRALTQISEVARLRRWLSWGKTRRLRTAAVSALAGIGTAQSRQALDDLAKHGDFFLRQQLRSAAGSKSL